MEGLAPLNTLFSLADSHNRAIITNLPCRLTRITVCFVKRQQQLKCFTQVTGDRTHVHFRASLELTPLLGPECRSLVLMKLAKQRSAFVS